MNARCHDFVSVCPKVDGSSESGKFQTSTGCMFCVVLTAVLRYDLHCDLRLAHDLASETGSGLEGHRGEQVKFRAFPLPSLSSLIKACLVFLPLIPCARCIGVC